LAARTALVLFWVTRIAMLGFGIFLLALAQV
jgi:hypothetical protein